MFTSFYHLRCRPFENSPDPAFLYLSKQHREVLYALLYGIESAKGFILLAGDVGTGKTTLVRALLKEIDHRHTVITVADPRSGFAEILAHLYRKLDLHGAEGLGLAGLELLAQRLAALHGAGQRVVLLIDEAHLLPEETLEGIRLLSNVEDERTKLVQIVLVGQNEIYPLLERGSQRSLQQRIVVNRQLRPLTWEETRGYIGHRLAEAGGGSELFSRPAVAMIWHASCGTPRVINQICDNALVTGYALAAQVIGPRIVREVLHDMGPLRPKAARPFFTLPLLVWPRGSLAAALILLSLGLGVAGLNSQETGDQPPPSQVQSLALAPTTGRPDAAATPEPGRPVAGAALATIDPLPVAPPVVKAVAPPVAAAPPPAPLPPPAVAVASTAEVTPPALPDVAAPVAAGEVIIPPDESLGSLAGKRYGVASETVLDLIQTANAGLADINQVHAGQSVRFPAITRESMVVRGDDGKYHIHYASFFAEENARRVTERFVRAGRESFFTPCRQGASQVFRVFVGSFGRHAEAVEALKTIEFKNLPFLNRGQG